MAYEDMNMEPEEHDEETPTAEDSGNRTFIIVAGAIGAVLILSIVCLALYALVIRPRQENQRATQVAAINAQNTQVAVAAAQTALAAKATWTPTATQPATATPTSVLASPTVGLASPTIDRTATVAALLTEAAAGKLTATPTSSALPTTGFAEDVGVPGLFGIALVMILLIFLARRLRTASS
jgi:LPXTG-motif cell wall-anchored protein